MYALPHDDCGVCVFVCVREREREREGRKERKWGQPTQERERERKKETRSRYKFRLQTHKHRHKLGLILRERHKLPKKERLPLAVHLCSSSSGSSLIRKNPPWPREDKNLTRQLHRVQRKFHDDFSVIQSNFGLCDTPPLNKTGAPSVKKAYRDGKQQKETCARQDNRLCRWVLCRVRVGWSCFHRPPAAKTVPVRIGITRCVHENDIGERL